MNKKPKRRYETVTQIKADIDRYKSKAQKLMEQAAKLDEKAELLIKENNPNLSESIGFTRGKAKECRRASFRILDRKLPKLKDKLAEFSTDVLPGIGINDRSIQA